MLDFNIVTFHNAKNYGAVLQAFALQEFVEELGYNVGIYDYKPPYINQFSGLRGKINKFIYTCYNKDIQLKDERFNEFSNSCFKLNLEMNSKVYLSGSDQVWNPTGNMNPIFFLNFVGDKSIRASYAASMGKCQVPLDKIDLFRSYIQRFDCISVREDDVKKCIEDFVDKKINVNIDPTLLMKSDFWRKHMRSVSDVPNNYILAYILHLPKNVNRLLKWLQKEMHSKIVLIDAQGTMSFLVHNNISLRNVGPREFLWLIDHANAVVTSSFHGTAFSLIFHKEFYSIVNPSAPSRISNILNLAGIEPISEDSTSFKRSKDIDWDKIDDLLSNKRFESEKYLESVYQYSTTIFRNRIQGNVNLYSDSCTGCSACEAICPVDAISLKLNEDGFYYPNVNLNLCINCSKCINTCPINKKIGTPKLKSYYGWNNDINVLFNSSSGGIFRALANNIIENDGIVFGAVYSDGFKSVVFSDTDSVSIDSIQKSKYTVSNPSGVFNRIKENLDSGRTVLFCGTPCQNAGLTQYLGKDYDNLLRCDFVCGGMSSISFYREHLSFLEKKYNSNIVKVDFRPKNKGWGKQRILIEFENGKVYFVRSHKDLYFKCFANEHVSVRSTCLDCEFYAFHVSDITLADFWGYKSAHIKANKKGLSLAIANSEKGIQAIERLKDCSIFELDSKYSDYAVRSKSPNVNKIAERNRFFSEAIEHGFELAAASRYKTSEFARVISYLTLKFKIRKFIR